MKVSMLDVEAIGHLIYLMVLLTSLVAITGFMVGILSVFLASITSTGK
jgi:hypothetical protein